ncbi:unnamed protein product [Ectocarpus sp. CCAP 1310/34]|nr:unnamed protein product [Ectocarpus sp. CCAP 1310/34]
MRALTPPTWRKISILQKTPGDSGQGLYFIFV